MIIWRDIFFFGCRRACFSSIVARFLRSPCWFWTAAVRACTVEEVQIGRCSSRWRSEPAPRRQAGLHATEARRCSSRWRSEPAPRRQAGLHAACRASVARSDFHGIELLHAAGRASAAISWNASVAERYAARENRSRAGVTGTSVCQVEPNSQKCQLSPGNCKVFKNAKLLER